MFVLLGTPEAVASSAVREEVLEFRKTGRPIVVVSFKGSVEVSELYKKHLKGLPIAPEPRTATECTGVGERTLSRIDGAFTYTTRSRRLKRIAVAGVAILPVVSIGGYCVNEEQSLRAEEARREAERKAEDAEIARINAMPGFSEEAVGYGAEGQPPLTKMSPPSARQPPLLCPRVPTFKLWGSAKH